MKKILFCLTFLAFLLGSANAQKYFTRNGNISFYSDTPLEKIEAKNSSATSVLDSESGKMEFAVLIKGFQFPKSLMQEHFNENYMESSTYPKALYKGEITNMDAVNFKKDGEYTANIKGELTIHGVTQPKEATGTYIVKDGKIKAKSNFMIAIADYGIEVPGVVKDNIAKEVSIKVELDYEAFKK
jgi:hypothetical protein